MHEKYKKLAEEIFRSIAAANTRENRDSIPLSDEFIMRMVSTLGIDERIVFELLRILRESHHILVMVIVKEDANRRIRRVEGYVDADFKTIHHLRDLHDKLLVDMYDETFKKRIMARQIVHELFPRVNQYNNTPLGQILNKVIMLEEFEKLISKHYAEYTDTWKEKKLDELIGDNLSILSPSAPEKKLKETVDKQPQRAVDTVMAGDMSAMGSRDSLARVLNIYGLEFFLRVHLRKYQFDYVQQIVEDGYIKSKADLLLIKNMIQKVKFNVDMDKGLRDRMDDLLKLERVVSRAMFSVSR